MSNIIIEVTEDKTALAKVLLIGQYNLQVSAMMQTSIVMFGY